jgi:hypothetical protein
MSHSEANDAPFRVEAKPDGHWCPLRDAFGRRPLQGVAPPYGAPRAVFAWDNRVRAISSVAKGGIPIRWEHAPDYANALSLSVADP